VSPSPSSSRQLPHCSAPGSVDDVVEDEELEVGVEVEVELDVLLVVCVDEVTVVLLGGSDVVDEVVVLVVDASAVVDVVSVVLVVVGRMVVEVVSVVLVVVGRTVVDVVSVVLVVVARVVLVVVGSSVVEVVDDVGSTVVVVVTAPAWASDPSDASHTRARSDASMLRRHDGQAPQTRSSKGTAATPPPTSGSVQKRGRIRVSRSFAEAMSASSAASSAAS
jgi:hypothetical protein